MSTFAAARVETKIVLQGEGNAAKAVRDTRTELDQMGQSADKAAGKGTGGFASMAQTAQQSMSRVGGAFSAVNAVIGGTNPTVQKLGQSFTAAGAVAGTIPGPIGLILAGITALGTATYLWHKEMSQADAKSRWMRGGAGSESLAESIGISQEAVLQMQLGLEDLRAKGLEPSKELMRALTVRVVEMGGDGSKAVTGLVDAIAKGPEALRQFQQTVGNLNIGTLSQTSEALGLSKETLGIKEDEVDVAAKVADLQKRYNLAIAERSALEQKWQDIRTKNEEELDQSTGARIERGAKLSKMIKDDEEEYGRAADARLAKVKDEAAAFEASQSAKRAAAAEQKAIDIDANIAKSQAALWDIRASAETDQLTAKRYKLEAIEVRLADVGDRRAYLESQIAKYSQAEYTSKNLALDVEESQLEAQRDILQRNDADRAKAEAAAAKAKEARKAEFDATLRMAKAQLDNAEVNAKNVATNDYIIAQKRHILELEKEAAISAAKEKTNTTKGRLKELEAIEVEFAGKEKALDKSVADAQAANADAVRKLKVEEFERVLQIELDADKRIQAVEKDKQNRLAEQLRSRGEYEKATLVEIAQAEADNAAAVLKIRRDLEVALIGLDDESDAAKKLRAAANAEIQAQQQALAEKTAKSYAKQSEDTSKAIDNQMATIDRIVSSAASAGGLQDASKSVISLTTNLRQGSKAWGEYQAAVAKGDTDKITKAQEGLSVALDGTISASGAAAAAFVDDEKTKAGILALTETAASIAAFATGNVPGGIGHAASAAIYAGIAGGAIPSAGGTQAAAGGGATTGGGAVEGTTGQGAAGGSAAVTQVFNFNKGFIFGSQQEVAKGISGTLRSVTGTGYDKRKAV